MADQSGSADGTPDELPRQMSWRRQPRERPGSRTYLMTAVTVTTARISISPSVTGV
jgi:hypothetical protein